MRIKINISTVLEKNLDNTYVLLDSLTPSIQKKYNITKIHMSKTLKSVPWHMPLDYIGRDFNIIGVCNKYNKYLTVVDGRVRKISSSMFHNPLTERQIKLLKLT